MRCLETEEFPYYPTDDVWRREEFSKFIQYQGNLWDDKIIKQTMHGLALSWSYMPHAFDVQCGKMYTPLQTFLKDKEKIKKKMEQLGHVDSPSGLRKALKVMSGSQGVSNFRPTAAQAIYEKFMPDGGTTWDMSGGYGGRLLGAIKTHINYIATEPATLTFKGLTQMAEDWGNQSNLFGTKQKLEIIQSGSENYVPKEDSLDLCFTSPPYFDTEKYSEEITQSYKKFPTKVDWLEGFLRRTIKNCYFGLKKNRYLIINIANVSSFDTLEDETANIVLSEGFEYLDTFQLSLSKMPGKNLQGDMFKYEPIFLFRKK
jgi:hypothetical protein